MAIIQSYSNVAYDGQRPIRESIKASGLVIVNSAHTLANASALANDVIILARETLRESLIEAKIDAKKAEINGIAELARLEAELEKAKAELASA